MKAYDALFKRYGLRHRWPGDTRDEILIGAILTQNLAWTYVEKAVADPLKASANLVVRELRAMWLDVVMMTGDNKRTAGYSDTIRDLPRPGPGPAPGQG